MPTSIMVKPSGSTSASNGAPQKSPGSSAWRHSPTQDELQALADSMDKTCTFISKYEQKRSSKNDRNGVSAGLKVHIESVLNDLMLAAGEAGAYGLVFKMITLIKQRVDKMKEVDEKAQLLKTKLDRVMNQYEKMTSKFASATNSPEDLEQHLGLSIVELLLDCNAVLLRIIPKASDKQLTGSKHAKDIFARHFKRFFTASANLQDVDKYISKLDGFVIDLMAADRARTVNNILPHRGEKCAMGGDFCHSVNKLKTFMTDDASGIRVLMIHGDPGRGKSRMAIEILYGMQSDQRADLDPKIELLHLDCSSTSGTRLDPLHCQRTLIEQIADGRAAEGLASKEKGYTIIENIMRAWASGNGTGKKRKVVLFLDNVPTHTSILADVLPPRISDLLPSGSCVVVSTSGDDSDFKTSCVFEQIQRMFSKLTNVVKEHNVKQLTYMEARNLFEQYSKGPPDADDDDKNEVVHELVKRCDHNPKLLVTLGQFFETKSRDLGFWRRTLQKLEDMDSSAITLESLSVHWREYIFKVSSEKLRAREQKNSLEIPGYIAKLELAYKMKLENLECEDAMNDISNIFDGWNWDAVEAIIGRENLWKLKHQKVVSSKLVLQNHKNPDPAQGSYQVRTWTDVAVLMNSCGRRSPTQMSVVQADPELRANSCIIHGDKYLHAVDSPIPAQLSDLKKGMTLRLRSLCLVDCKGDFQLGWLDRIEDLRYLVLHNVERTEGVTLKPKTKLCYLHWSSKYSISFPFEAENLPILRFLVLTDFDFKTKAGHPFKIPAMLENLSLVRCRNVNLILESLFKSTPLNSLHLQECEGIGRCTVPLQPRSSTPFSLSFQNIADMTVIPAFIQKLRRPTKLAFISCENLKGEELALETDPKLKRWNPQDSPSLKSVRFENCCYLTCLPAELAPYSESLTELDIRFCKIQELSSHIAVFKNLTELTVASCLSVNRLPPELGNLRKLQSLSLKSCLGLQFLPPEIGILESLKSLDLAFCRGLKSLPVEIENLKALSKLSMQFCCGFDWGTLPDLGKLQDLNHVNIRGMKPDHVRDTLAKSTDAIHRPDGDPLILIQDLPTYHIRSRRGFYSAPEKSQPAKNGGTKFKSAN